MQIMPRLKGGYIFVEGTSVGEVDWSVLRDRELLAQGGVFFAFLNLNGDGSMIGAQEIIARGFVDAKDGAEIIDGAKGTIEQAIKLHKANGGGKLSNKIEDALNRYVYAETGRRPLVQVVIK
jgi:ribonuclease J